jgi:predicted ATP-grasp superfamily ATP-dependent carboligase
MARGLADLERRALVTDAEERSVLAVIRCLHDAGFDVTAAASTRLAPGLWSRACSARSILRGPGVDVEGFLGRLESLLRTGRNRVLIPGTDATLYAVSRHRERLARYVRIGLPDHETVERALDRACVSRSAAAVGLAAPDGRVCERVEEALERARVFGFPVLVKPVRTVAELDDRLIRHSSRLARDEDTVRELHRQLGRCIVQRRETGDVISFAGVATEQGLLGSVVSRYRRTWPPEGGNACFSETIAVPGSLAERVEALVGAIGWRGLFELELIERADGSMEAIDFNPRAYGSLSLACAAGVPLPAIWCKWLLGERPLVPKQRVGARYRWEDADLRHAAWQLRHGSVKRAAGVLAPQLDVTHAYFRPSDPAPLLARGLQLARARRA